MKFYESRQAMVVAHINGHVCGEICWDSTWNNYYYQPKTSGLDSDDLRQIANKIDKLNHKPFWLFNIGHLVQKLWFKIVRLYNRR